eukprot:g20993.t1
MGCRARSVARFAGLLLLAWPLTFLQGAGVLAGHQAQGRQVPCSASARVARRYWQSSGPKPDEERPLKEQ